jgi:hypothetical protein
MPSMNPDGFEVRKTFTIFIILKKFRAFCGALGILQPPSQHEENFLAVDISL